MLGYASPEELTANIADIAKQYYENPKGKISKNICDVQFEIISRPSEYHPFQKPLIGLTELALLELMKDVSISSTDLFLFRSR